jgi:hypothetical protein
MQRAATKERAPFGDISARKQQKMTTITRTLGAVLHHEWAALVPLVLISNISVASLAWWSVGAII